jgi:Caspase domain
MEGKRMRRVTSLTDAVKHAATREASLTDAVKEAAREGLGGKAYRATAGSPGSALNGRHDGSQGGRHPWGPAPAPDSSLGRKSRLGREPDLQEPGLSRTGTEPPPARFARLRGVPHVPRIVRLPKIRLADPVLRLMSTGVRLAGIALLSFVSLVATPTVMGPDRPGVTQPQKRVALVIGNSAYRHARKLENPRNDAADVGAALVKLGFQVIEGFDLDKAGLDAKIRVFTAALKGADVGLFFYAGHGLHVSGQNFLVPVDAELTAISALDLELVRLDLIHRTMERETPTNLLFFDACRDNPLSDNLARAMGGRAAEIGRGLTAAQSGAGTLISFSTQPGKVAHDGKGRNSPYSGALVRQLTSSKEDLAGMLMAVRNEVVKETNRKQVPWEHSALTGRFYFGSEGEKQAPAPAPHLLAREAFEAWSATRDTTSIGVLDAFIARYRDTFYAALARARIEELRKLDEVPLASSTRGAVAPR